MGIRARDSVQDVGSVRRGLTLNVAFWGLIMYDERGMYDEKGFESDARWAGCEGCGATLTLVSPRFLCRPCVLCFRRAGARHHCASTYATRRKRTRRCIGARLWVNAASSSRQG